MKRVAFLLFAVTMLWSCASKKKQDFGGEEMLNTLIKERYEEKNASGMFSSVMFGSKKQPVRFYITQLASEEEMREKLQPLLTFLEKETKLYYEIRIPKTYDEMIQAFAKDEAHFALMNSLSFVKAKEAYGAYARLKTIRYRTSSYFGQIIARADLKIEDLAELQGKSIAYTDTSSASGFLYPNIMLAEQGVVPSAIIFAGSHDNVVRMIYNGEVDAGATYYSAPDDEGNIRDARVRLIKEYEDVAEAVNLVTVTRPIPNDPIVFGRQINKKLSYEICNALIKYMSMPEAKSSLGELFGIDGFVRSSDSDYNVLREAMILKDSLTTLSVPTS